MGGAEGGGVDMGMSRFDGNVKADMAHFLGALPGSYPVTPLAVFALGCRFDR
jgi:hypothetical protein